MLRVKMLFSLAVMCILVMAGSAQAAIPGGWVETHHYTLGEAEGGIIGNVAADPAIDSVGGANLTLTGAPIYAAGSTTPIAVDFSNPITTAWEPAIEYYRDATLDFNPIDPANWGLSLDVRVDEITTTAHSHDFVALHACFNPGYSVSTTNLIISEIGGDYGMTLAGGWYATGVPVTLGGGWDHLELTTVGGVMDLEINGTPVGFNFAVAFDPGAGLMIGASPVVIGDAMPPSRGANAAIDEVVFYNVPEPATLILLGLGALALHRRKR